MIAKSFGFGQNLMSLETLDNESDESLRLALRETWWYRFGFAHLYFILGIDIRRMLVCLFVCFLEVLYTTFLKVTADRRIESVEDRGRSFTAGSV